MRDFVQEVRHSGVLSAVQRLIFCPTAKCGKVLDIGSAVLVTSREDDSTTMVCGKCWGKVSADLNPVQFSLLEVWNGEGLELSSDGRTWS